VVGQATIYDDITRISEDYFGPVAPRFISRLITNHLNKKPEQVTSADLPRLINWIKLSMAMMTDETDTISEYIERLNKLAAKA
jgi:hypothetical protein